MGQMTAAAIEDDYPHAVQQRLKQASVALEWLMDLRDTIAVEGVSQDDIRAVSEIRATLSTEEHPFETHPSLEQYNPAHYLPERSHMNVAVATESIGRTIVQVVKNFFRNLMDYLTRMVRWIKRSFKSEEKMQYKYDVAVKVIQATREGIAKLEYKAAGRSHLARLTKNLNEAYKKSAENELALLKSDQVENNDVTRAAFGIEPYVKQIERICSQTVIESKVLVDEVERLARYVSPTKRDSRVPVDFVAPSKITALLEYANEHQVISVNASRSIATIEGVAVFDRGIGKDAQRLIPYMDLITTYERLHDLIRQAERGIQGEGLDVDQFTRSAATLNRAIDDLSKLSTFVYNYNQTRLRALSLTYTALKQRFTLLQEYYSKRTSDPAMVRLIQGIADSLVEELTKIMR